MCGIMHQVGGLGDVVTGLGRALQRKGHRVEIILPKYRTLELSGVKNLKVGWLRRRFLRK
jgi:starch synthase